MTAKPPAKRTRPHVVLTLDPVRHAEAKKLAEAAGLPLSRWIDLLIRKEGQAMSRITTRLRYDTTDPSRPGWYAEYFRDGELLAHSEQVGHPDLPTDPGARSEAAEIVDLYAAGFGS